MPNLCSQRLLRRAVCILAGVAGLSGACHGQGPGDAAERITQALNQAWQSFAAGRFAAAERDYQKALALGEDSGDAELGLGWSLQRQGRCEEARPHFLLVQRQRPGDASAQDGLQLCPPPRPLRLYPSLAQGIYV